MSESNTKAISEMGPAEGRDAMPAEFGLATATFVVVASMVGTGVLTTSGYTIATVDSNLWMLILWIVGGLTAICGALTLAELSAAMPRTGGDYVYLYEAYGPLPAFLSGWVSFLIGFAAPGAASAFASAKYLLTPFQGPGANLVLLERVLATVLILAFAALHLVGRRQTAHVQGWITAVKLVLLAGFAGAGLAAGWPNLANLYDPRPVDVPFAMGLLSSLVYIYYAYTGWNAASYLAGEVREPQRLLPRAILLGTGGVLVLYMVVNVVYALALTPAAIHAIIDDPSNREGFDAVAPIAELAARRLFGPGWAGPLSVSVGVMLLSSLSAYLLIGPRVLYAMAESGQFPAVAARLTRRARTPAVATAFQLSVTMVLLWVGSVESIILYAGVGLSIFSMLAMSSIFVLRRRRPEMPRPFRTPGYPVTPAVYLLLTGMMTLAAFSQRPVISGYALLSILAGVPFYYLWRWGAAGNPGGDRPAG